MDNQQQKPQERKENTPQFQREVRSRIMGYVVGALSLVAGLAWNDAIKSLIENWFPLPSDSVSAKLFYAFIVSILAVVITISLARAFESSEEK